MKGAAIPPMRATTDDIPIPALLNSVGYNSDDRMYIAPKAIDTNIRPSIVKVSIPASISEM